MTCKTVSRARRLALLALSLLAGLALCCADGNAALRAKKNDATLEEATNPRPDRDDFALPMPCGGSMAMRAVGSQAEGFLWDVQTLFGCDNCERRENDYYERRYSTAVSGPFSARDLAPTGTPLPKAEAGEYYFYFLGKYEVSNFQWRAVMDGWCPSSADPLTPEDALPRTGLSWFEANEFSRAYTEWLLKNAPGALPRFSGDSKNIGYLRLPTEAEWEYAARGGHAVPRASLREQDFYTLEQGTDYPDYAVFRASGGGGAEDLRSIGSRRPNPLGLYDTAGNAAEMTMDPFHFSLGGRLHGSSGGFVRKGGSFLSSLNEILPGRREEAALFIAEGPNKARDLGLRLALSGINTPAGGRPAELAREWKKAGESTGLLLDQGKNPLTELDRLIASSANPHEKENLSRLRGVIKDNNIALERQRAMAAENLIRSSLFMVETVRNYAVRHKSFVNMISESVKERERAKNMSAAIKAAVEKTVKDLRTSRVGMERSLDAAVGFYRSKVEESLEYPEDLFKSKLKSLGGELKGDDILAVNMRKAHELYARHVNMARAGKQGQLTRAYLIKDILPDNLREGLQ